MQQKLYKILMIVLSLVMIGCVIYLVVYYGGAWLTDNEQKDLEQYIEEVVVATEEEMVASTEDDGEPTIQPKYQKLYEMNPDFAGWLSIAGTDISYAVMQSMEDEEFYLHRDFYGEYSSPGMLFIDTSCDIMKPTVNIMIYGHNMKSGTMFHDLLNYAEESYYKEHSIIKFNSLYRDGTYEVIGAFYTEVSEKDADVFKYYNFFDTEDEAEFDAFVKNVKALTTYDTADAKFGDELLTLSTCAYHVDNGRFVVVAKRIS